MFLTNYVSKIFQFWELLATYFDNYLKNALFGILGSKVGILSTKISKKERTSPNMGTHFEGNCKLVWNFLGFLGFFGFRTILSYFRVFWRPFWTILSIIRPINIGKYMVLHHVDVEKHVFDRLQQQNMSIQSHFCNLIWWIMSKAQIDENVLKNFIITKIQETSWAFRGSFVGSKASQKATETWNPS